MLQDITDRYYYSQELMSRPKGAKKRPTAFDFEWFRRLPYMDISSSGESPLVVAARTCETRATYCEKKRAYDQRIREVEHGTFCPLVFSCTGGMGRAAVATYKRLAALVAGKRDQPYSQIMGWIRCRLSFSLLRPCSQTPRGPSRPDLKRGAHPSAQLN